MILYELLTGNLPYKVAGVAIHEAVRMVKEEMPTKLSTIDRNLRGDIETITLKALEKDRDRRYQSAIALEEDIVRFLAGDPIAARRPSFWFHLKRFATRHTAAALAIVVTVSIIVVAVLAILVFAFSEASQRRIADRAKIEAQLQTHEAEQAMLKAEQAQEEALQQAYFGNIHAADAAVSEGTMATALRRLADAHEVMGTVAPDQLPFEWRYLKARSDDSLDIMRGHESRVNSVTFNPDGTYLASGSDDTTIRIWDTNTGEIFKILRGHETYISSIAYSPDGTLLASAGYDTTIRLWNTKTGETLTTLLGHEHALWSVTFSSHGIQRNSVTQNQPMRLWDTITGEEDRKSVV